MKRIILLLVPVLLLASANARASSLYLCESKASYELGSDGALKPSKMPLQDMYADVSFDSETGLLRMGPIQKIAMRIIQTGDADPEKIGESQLIAVWTDERPLATLHESFRIILYKPSLPFVFVDYLSQVVTGTCKVR